MSRDHKLIFVGTAKQREFRGGGIDDGKDYPIDCKQNDTIYVTEDKKAELLNDHPEWFVIDLDLPESSKKQSPSSTAKSDPAPKVETKTEPAVAQSPETESEPEIIVPDKEDLYPDLESMTNAELRDLAGTDNKRLSKKKLIKMIKDKLKNKSKER